MPDPLFDPNAPLPDVSAATAANDLARRMGRLVGSPRAGVRLLSNRDQSRMDTSSTRVRRIRRARQQFDAAEDVVVMEYVPKGDLGLWLERFNRLDAGPQRAYGARPPATILWSVFHCLMRGAIAMAYPLDRDAGVAPSGPGERVVPGTQRAALRTELLPTGTQRETRPTDPAVHFNLNLSTGE